jgi:Protein of unknown function (DUF2793)
MPDDKTARHALPNLFVGQSQKEITHNEALARIDALLHPVVENWITTPPSSLGMADDGKCWLIKAPATGEWAGRTNQIARWSGGSWRYLSPVAGMVLWHANAQLRLFYTNAAWSQYAAIANPVGGTVVDSEARATLVQILGHLRQISNITP